MDDRYRRTYFRRMHRALETPHHRRLSGHRLEVVPEWYGWGIRRVLWFGSRMNETIHYGPKK